MLEALERSGDSDGRRQFLRQGIVRSPLEIPLYRQLNNSYLLPQDTGLKVRAWEDVAASCPESVWAMYYLAQARISAGDTPGALEVLKQAASTPLADGEAATGVGVTLLNTGEYGLAAEVLRKAVDAVPDAASSAWIPLVEALIKSGDNTSARRAIEQARAHGVVVPETLAAAVEMTKDGQ